MGPKIQPWEYWSDETRNEKYNNQKTPIGTTNLNGQWTNVRRVNLAGLDRLPNHYAIEGIVDFGP